MVLVLVVLEKKIEQWEEHANQLGGEEEHSAEYQHHKEVPPNSSVRRSYHRPGKVEPLAGWEERRNQRPPTQLEPVLGGVHSPSVVAPPG